MMPNDIRVALVRLIMEITIKAVRDNASAPLAIGSRNGFFDTWWSAIRVQAVAMVIIRSIGFVINE